MYVRTFCTAFTVVDLLSSPTTMTTATTTMQQDFELQEDAAVAAGRLPEGGREARAGGAPRGPGSGEQ